ncbi:MAG: inovirus Gp2 family protein [Thiothrix sp.]|nr:MAG: inovirus Gp2 family protein [Thiothrix sp.]
MPPFAQKTPYTLVCGFVPSVLSRPELQDLKPARLAVEESEKNRAVFNNICISPKSTLKINRDGTRRTKNRKYITHSDTIEHQGIEYPINSTKSGIYTSIMHRAIEQLDACLQRWGRVLAVRFDLHHKGIQTHSNKWLSKFIKNLKRKIERAYDFSDLGFIWVREQERGKAQHYHLAIWLDGDVVRHPAQLTKLISETWEAINPANTIYYPSNHYYFVDSEEAKRDFVYRMSYLAKARGKGYRNEQVKDYQCSRLG